MKKIFYPILGVGLAFCLQKNTLAADWTYDVGGQAYSLYGYADLDKNDVLAKSENHFENIGFLNASVTYSFNDDYSISWFLDVMGATDKEIQNFNNGSWGKQISADLNTPFGTLSVGEIWNAAYNLSVSAPQVGPLYLNNSEIVDFISNPNWFRRNKKYTSFKTLNSTDINTDGTALKAAYYTPEFYNTVLGFSYTPDTQNRRGLVNNQAKYARDDAYNFGLANNFDCGAFNIQSSLGYGIFHKNDKEFSAGINLSYGNWDLGGAFRKTYVEGSDFAITSNFVSDKIPALFDNYREGKAWNVGIGYKFGPLKTSLGYFEAQADNTSNQDEIVLWSNDFQVNKYLNLYASAAHVNFKGDSNLAEDNRKGYAFVAGVGFQF